MSVSTSGPPSLRDQVYVKKYLRYTRRYVVVEMNSLYYYAKSNSIRPEFFTSLNGFRVVEKGL